MALRNAPAGRGELFLRWIFLQISVAALYLPWILLLLRQLGHVREDFWTTVPTLRTLGGTLSTMRGRPGCSRCSVSPSSPERGPRAPKEEPEAAWPSPRAVILPWLLVPLAGPFVASYLVAPIFLTRITLPALPALMLLAARGVARLRSTWARAALASALLLGTAFPLISMYREPNKERWREVAADIDAWASPGDLLLVHAPYCKIEVLDYYLRRRDLEVVPFPENARGASPTQIPPSCTAGSPASPRVARAVAQPGWQGLDPARRSRPRSRVSPSATTPRWDTGGRRGRPTSAWPLWRFQAPLRSARPLRSLSNLPASLSFARTGRSSDSASRRQARQCVCQCCSLTRFCIIVATMAAFYSTFS